nr:alkyl sulfatase dimerization domain-containing protein [Paraburkholderia strydomiana]
MFPEWLSRKWHTRDYYGAVVHNVQAIYAFYMGPYDGNPSTLHPLHLLLPVPSISTTWAASRR